MLSAEVHQLIAVLADVMAEHEGIKTALERADMVPDHDVIALAAEAAVMVLLANEMGREEGYYTAEEEHKSS